MTTNSPERTDVPPGVGAYDRTAAGGTIGFEEVSNLYRSWLVIEIVLLFVLTPLVMHRAVHGEGTPLFVALLPVLGLAFAALWADPKFRLRTEFSRGLSWGNALTILAVFVLLGGAIAYWMSENKPEWFLEFPKNRPERFKQIILLYPIASVAAQELVYRTFYFHRYGPLFGRQVWLAVLLNGLLFGWAHVVIGSPFAVLSTAAGGLLLATRYAVTRSYWAVFIEHTLWGWFVFTVGLGRFFFTGIPNVR